MDLTRTFSHKLFRLEDHLDRLYRTLRTMRVDPGMSFEEMARLSHEIVEKNAESINQLDELGLIHFVTPGTTPAYANVPRERAARTNSADVWHAYLCLATRFMSSELPAWHSCCDCADPAPATRVHGFETEGSQPALLVSCGR